MAGDANVLITYAVVASFVELSFVAGVVPVDTLLSAVAPVTTSVPPTVVFPEILVAPPIPTPPLTISAPLPLAVDAVALETVATPEMFVVLSVDTLLTVTLLSVLAAVPDDVIPFVNVASPLIKPLPEIS